MGAKFGIAVGSDSDSSDAEFAPENEERDSCDSVSGDDGGSSSGEEGGDEEEEGEEEEESRPREGDRGRQEDRSAGKKGERGGTKGYKEMKAEAEAEKGEEETGAAKEVRKEGEDDKDVESEMIVDKETFSADIATGTGSEDTQTSSAMKDEYNPLIVRRSNRAIKPTKDIDLYLLGAKFGIDVEGSGAESSDMEFAPADNSPGTTQTHPSASSSFPSSFLISCLCTWH